MVHLLAEEASRCSGVGWLWRWNLMGAGRIKGVYIHPVCAGEGEFGGSRG